MAETQQQYLELVNTNNEGIFMISKENCELCDKLRQLFERNL